MSSSVRRLLALAEHLQLWKQHLLAQLLSGNLGSVKRFEVGPSNPTCAKQRTTACRTLKTSDVSWSAALHTSCCIFSNRYRFLVCETCLYISHFKVTLTDEKLQQALKNFQEANYLYSTVYLAQTCWVIYIKWLIRKHISCFKEYSVKPWCKHFSHFFTLFSLNRNYKVVLIGGLYSYCILNKPFLFFHRQNTLDHCEAYMSAVELHKLTNLSLYRGVFVPCQSVIYKTWGKKACRCSQTN